MLLNIGKQTKIFTNITKLELIIDIYLLMYITDKHVNFAIVL